MFLSSGETRKGFAWGNFLVGRQSLPRQFPYRPHLGAFGVPRRLAKFTSSSWRSRWTPVTSLHPTSSPVKRETRGHESAFISAPRERQSNPSNQIFEPCVISCTLLIPEAYYNLMLLSRIANAITAIALISGGLVEAWTPYCYSEEIAGTCDHTAYFPPAACSCLVNWYKMNCNVIYGETNSYCKAATNIKRCLWC